MNFIPALTTFQWLLLAAIPPAIISLYFLKLKRHPVEVPSTYLWTRTIEDLHVNSIWQRLRQSLLLFLQLLVLLLAILACLRPGWRGTNLVGDRFIFMVDTSASMSATDVGPSRLEAAKKHALGLIDQMESSDVAMVISFSDVPRIEQAFTNNRSALRQAVNKISQTNRRTDISEALRHASGLANPGRTSEAGTSDVQVADALPATMYIISDGGVPAVPDFSPGNLTAVYVKIGTATPNNVGIVAFSTERNPEKPGQLQAFARLENSSGKDVEVDVALYLDGGLVDASSVTVPTDAAEGVSFVLNDIESAILKLEIQHKDDMLLDNAAFATINTPRRARVLVVTLGNDALKFAITTEAAAKVADVAFAEPAVLETKEHETLALAGAYDLIVYDRCTPKVMPEANTLFIGRVPPAEGWSADAPKTSPLIIDIDRLHPLMHLVELGSILIYDSLPLKGPEGAKSLIDSDNGPLLMIAPRKGFEDAVLAFELVGAYPDGDVNAKTNWPRRKSFPVFVMNTVRYLGGARASLEVQGSQPGQPVKLRTEAPTEQIVVESPSGVRTKVQRESQNSFIFTRAEELGVYSVREGTDRETGQHFAINLFDSRESDLIPREVIDIPYFDEATEQVGVHASLAEPSRKEMWKLLLIVGLVVLVFEWYVYNRRVYL
ncbi:MAG: VWA domain-containing protein [Planctomycetaceae bacterium]|nr:BatA and WFA domain-containing protein [Planctomycetales bacterium]MCB9938088.1 VWA domain-containing protein [Planctomycetaceae bacterium]